MNTLPILTVPALAGLAFALVTLAGCGQADDSAQAAEQDPLIHEETGATAMERAVGFIETWADLFDAMNDQMGTIDSREAANEHAVWLNDDLTPRMERLVDDMIGFMGSLDDEEMQAMEAEFDKPEHHQRMTQLEARLEESLDHLHENIMRVERTHATPALEAAWLNFAQANERLERSMEATFAGGEPVVGSPAWCEAMANTPQAQWTMNNAFAFAHHCTGR